MDLNLSGHVAVVTGASKGIGLAITRTLLDGAGDIIAAMTDSDRDAVITRLGPEMMQLTTGRLADPQEIADAVALLASPRSASTTGTELVVDSGFLKAV
jgi:NAD(P)-dependent dehydrogenase (short-subunit alcohol dehydrogenase family)